MARVGQQPLEGTLALVTGASRGIGLAVAEALEGAGAHVVRLARSLTDARDAKRTDLRCDVTQPREVEEVLHRVLEQRGVPDIVVNNAGVFFLRPFAETTPAEFAETVSTNLTGPFLVARATLPHMVRRGRGHLVTIGSVSDHAAFPDGVAYTASKWGVRGMHAVLTAELSGSGVRTTLVSPGPVDTAMWDPVDPDARTGFTKRADMMWPGDVADAVVFAVTRPPRVDVTEIRLMPATRPSDDE